MFSLTHGLNARGTTTTHGLNPSHRIPRATSSYTGRVIGIKYAGKVVGAYSGKIKKE